MSDEPAPDSSPGPFSYLPGGDERSVGLLTLQLLDSWRLWTKRRTEAVTFSEYEDASRQISVDFELPPDVIGAAVRLHGGGEDQPRQEFGVWGSDGHAPSVLIPLALFKKQSASIVDLRDEGGTRISTYIRDESGAVGAAALVTFGEGLLATRDSGAGPQQLTADLKEDLFKVATLPRLDAIKVYAGLHQARKGEPPESQAIRQELVTAEGFMGMARDLAENVLLLVRVPAQVGRRILQYSYESQRCVGDRDETFKGRIRRLRRWLGWAAQTLRIDVPEIGMCREYQTEITVPPGVRGTHAVLLARPGLSEIADPIRLDVWSSPRPGGARRVSLEGSAPSSWHGYVVLWVRPPMSMVVRATVAAGVTTALVGFIAIKPSWFQVQTEATVALLLLVPGSLTGYLAAVTEPSKSTQGVRALGLASAAWALLAATTLVIGTAWPTANYLIGGCATGALMTLVILLRTVRMTADPPERCPGLGT